MNTHNFFTASEHETKAREHEMTKERVIELLKIEHDCMLRASHDGCNRKCEDCDLVQDDDELHEMYTNVIDLIEKMPEFTRCGVCKHWRKLLLNPDGSGHCVIRNMVTGPDEWCSDGREKNDFRG